MSRLAAAFAAVALMAGVQAQEGSAPAIETEPALEWRTDVAAALGEAERDGRPVLAVFR